MNSLIIKHNNYIINPVFTVVPISCGSPLGSETQRMFCLFSIEKL